MEHNSTTVWVSTKKQAEEFKKLLTNFLWSPEIQKFHSILIERDSERRSWKMVHESTDLRWNPQTDLFGPIANAFCEGYQQCQVEVKMT